MKYIIRILCLADGRKTPADGLYLVSCDVDARDGRGFLKTTLQREDARMFSSVPEAHEYWRRQSTVMPLRPDGEPNRPLTAYTIEVEPLEEQPE